MKKIKLTRGKYATVDDANYKELSKYEWWFDGNYACREIRKDGRKKKIYMHRQIMEFPEKQVDHINRDKLDNRRENLRLCKPEQQVFNITKRKNNTSGYKGVIWVEKRKKWRACLYFNKKCMLSKQFTRKEDAAIAYNEVAKKYFGEFAYLNQI